MKYTIFCELDSEAMQKAGYEVEVWSDCDDVTEMNVSYKLATDSKLDFLAALIKHKPFRFCIEERTEYALIVQDNKGEWTLDDVSLDGERVEQGELDIEGVANELVTELNKLVTRGEPDKYTVVVQGEEPTYYTFAEMSDALLFRKATKANCVTLSTRDKSGNKQVLRVQKAGDIWIKWMLEDAWKPNLVRYEDSILWDTILALVVASDKE